MNDEFYIGYEPEMPARLAKRIRRVARGLVALALVTPAVLVFTEGSFAPGVFEYGRVRTFSGRIIADGALGLQTATQNLVRSSSLKGTVGDGSASLDVSTFSGDVTISRK